MFAPQVTTAQAASFYRVPERTMRYWLAKAGLERHGDGRRPQYDWVAVEALVEAHRRHADA